ncbi:deaminase [Pseudonocardia sp. ICBG1142]|uniref:deaminase n=1 Tax=Pseudonocardia sp. ICBG1142 TaxID=2846760 RepID=UPI001CF6381D|nr:deaminase [Pseudonocardia sp. ICBG1142]
MPDNHHTWLRQTIALAQQCPPSGTAFAVGALIVVGGECVSTGYSRETGPHEHAEEVALARLGTPPAGATLYSSLEPCSQRSSKPRTCTELILDSGIRRVVFAWREPDHFVTDVQSTRILREHGVDVVEVPDLADAARAVNRSVLAR